MRVITLPVAAALLLACGGGEASRHVATITNTCAESGEDRAACACVADSLRASLDDEGLAATAGFFAAIEAATSDAERSEIAMAVRDNEAVLGALDDIARISPICERLIAADGDDSGAAGALSGTYLPQLGDFPASERRLAASAADRRWEFSADGKVTTFSQGGARRWTYQVRGKEIRLTGAGSETRGERRRFTFHADGRCIWDGSGNSSVDMRFCPG
jgi:hypothetical protein